MFNTKLGPMPGKLKLRYDGPFKILEVYEQSTFLLANLHGNQFEKAMNGFRLKPYFGPNPSKGDSVPRIGIRIAVVFTCGIDWARSWWVDLKGSQQDQVGSRQLLNNGGTQKSELFGLRKCCFDNQTWKVEGCGSDHDNQGVKDSTRSLKDKEGLMPLQVITVPMLSLTLYIP